MKHLIKRLTCDLSRLFASLVKYAIELLVADISHALLNGTQELNSRLCQITFQLRVPFTGEVLFNLLRRLGRNQVINLEQVADCWSCGIETNLGP